MTRPDLDGEWLGFEEHLAQAIKEHLALQSKLIRLLDREPDSDLTDVPPDRTYEQHLVLEDFECATPMP